MSKLSVMVLCGRSPRHLYLANRLCESARVLAIVQESGNNFHLSRVMQQLKPGILGRKASRWARDRLRYAGGAEAKFFFGANQPRLVRQDLVVRVPDVSHVDVVALADRLQPDVIAVFGTSLIRGPLLSRGRLGIFNLHGGLAPRYRGADCTFWALYNGEPDQVGCTLHTIDPGIDTGDTIAHICPEVHETDDELELFWRAIRDGTEAFSELFDRLERGERLGQPQREKGRLYQVKQRGWRQERELAARLRAGLLTGIDLPRRTRWFPASADDRVIGETRSSGTLVANTRVNP